MAPLLPTSLQHIYFLFMPQTLPGEELGLWDKLQDGSKPTCSFPRISVPPSTTCTALPQSPHPLLHVRPCPRSRTPSLLLEVTLPTGKPESSSASRKGSR